MNILSRLDGTIKTYSFTEYGYAPLGIPLSIDIYKTWLERGLNAGMEYLKEHLPQKERPNELLPKAQAAIVVLQSYSPLPKGLDKTPFEGLYISKYARGSDYHFWFKDKLRRLCEDLKRVFPAEEFVAMTDSSPVMERDLAYQAGLGWFGKNSCLIHRKAGSFNFIGEIFTTLNTNIKVTPETDFCGKCDRCVQACPTQAILPNRTLDAKSCIAYWNIEAKTSAPEPLRLKMGELFFGCDICQDVCPWNRKVIDLDQTSPSQEALIDDLKWILTSSNRQIMKRVATTPLSRAGAKGLKRSALIVAGSKQLKTLKAIVETYTKDPSFLELAHWTLKQID